MANEVARSTQRFLMDGGWMQIGIQRLIEKGLMADPDKYEHQEYPKIIRISHGVKPAEMTTEDHRGRVISWVQQKEHFEDIVVHSEEEEDRVLSGGKTSVQIEEERQHLITRLRGRGAKVDPTWSMLRLRRELGEELDKPDTDELGELQAKLAKLEEMAEMRAKIAALESQLSQPVDSVASLRAELTALGVEFDGRWSVERLRKELDRATAPQEG